MRSIETRDAAALRDSELAVQVFEAAHLDIHKTAWRHHDAVFVADLDHVGTWCAQHREVRVVEGFQKAEVEHVKVIPVKEKGSSFGEVGGLEVPVVEVTATDDHFEPRLTRSDPERCVAAI